MDSFNFVTLGVYTLEVYSLGQPIWELLGVYTLGVYTLGVYSGGLHSGGLLSQAIDFGSGFALWGPHSRGLFWRSTLWGSTLSGNRFWIWKPTHNLGVYSASLHSGRLLMT